MNSSGEIRPSLRILLIEDNLADVSLIRRFLSDSNSGNPVTTITVNDGDEAMGYLERKGRFSDALRPHLILLDLNLPRKDGRIVLKEIKGHRELRTIPIVILSTSSFDKDVRECYENHANSFVVKPADLDGFEGVIQQVRDYWFRTVVLPENQRKKASANSRRI